MNTTTAFPSFADRAAQLERLRQRPALGMRLLPFRLYRTAVRRATGL